MAKFKETADSFFQRAKVLYYEKAHQISQSEHKMKKLVNKTSEKLMKFAGNPAVRDIARHTGVMVRMIKAQLAGTYKVSNRSLALIVLGLLYFIAPIDLIPDFIPGFGYVDDVSVLLAVTKSIQVDIQKFRLWETAPLN